MDGDVAPSVNAVQHAIHRPTENINLPLRHLAFGRQDQ
jgi:hypothetical protein